MVVGDVLDQPLEQHRVVARLDRVGDVMQVDLELRRGTFLDDGVGGDALLLGAFENVLQAVDVFVEVVDQVDLRRLRALAGDRRARRLRSAYIDVKVEVYWKSDTKQDTYTLNSQVSDWN